MNRLDPALLGIYRTDHTQTVNFYGSGKGRETYIIHNGGGLRKDKEYWGSKGRPSWDHNTKISSRRQSS